MGTHCAVSTRASCEDPADPLSCAAASPDLSLIKNAWEAILCDYWKLFYQHSTPTAQPAGTV